MLKSFCLNSYWKFKLDKEERGEKECWHENFPDNTEEIWVPSCWNEYKEEMLHFEGVGWYFKKIVINYDPDVQRQVLFFHGVNYQCEIWVNGKYVTKHRGGFTPFEADITSCIKYNEVNLIAIRVDSRLTQMTVPPMAVDWYNYGGIFRDVYLNQTGETWLNDVTVITRMDGTVMVRYELGQLVADGDQKLSLTLRVFDPEHACVTYQITREITALKGALDFSISNPRLWSPEDPFLYRFELSLSHDEILKDRWEHQIGLREFQIRDRKLLLNGKPIFLRGYSKHEEYPMLGRTFSYEIVRKDYEICKQGNCNFLRLCHYPHHLKEYQIASEAGFLVIAEIPNVNFKEAHFQDPEVRANSISQLKETIKYYKNETSIMFWSLFIECATNQESSIDFVTDYIRLTKELDPTRLTIHASITPDDDKTYDYFDVVGVNYWTGWYHNESIPAGSKLLDKIGVRYPDKPIIMTSGGWEGFYGFHSYRGGTYWSEEVQADYLEQLTEMYLTKEFIVGQILWTFNDFRVSPWYEPNDWYRGKWLIRPMDLNMKGVVDYYRRPKLAYYRLQETFKKWDLRK